jgi:hypothetical protein
MSEPGDPPPMPRGVLYTLCALAFLIFVMGASGCDFNAIIYSRLH